MIKDNNVITSCIPKKKMGIREKSTYKQIMAPKKKAIIHFLIPALPISFVQVCYFGKEVNHICQIYQDRKRQAEQALQLQMF